MRILIVSATATEIAPLVARLAGSERGHEVEVLVTGVGMVATSARTARSLAQSRLDLALNLGLCGSFDASLAPGSVVHVVSDRMTELGAEDGEGFLTIAELGLLDADAPPYSQGRLLNARPPANAALERLPSVHGITVNTVHGSERSIADVVRRFAPQVESMEGAGFMYACLMHDVPFAQVRAVSNFVERRNRSAWKIDEAIGNLCRVAQVLVESA